AVAAALEFDDPADEQSVELQALLRTEHATAFTTRTTGLDPEHPLFPRVRDAVVDRQQHLRPD
ncbi:MAG: mannitol-1-phosphate 5-dehydrogenase, partial [Actinobacteria bacterium HGW-Actinobacteria-11]